MKHVYIFTLFFSFSICSNCYGQYYNFPHTGWKQSVEFIEGDYTGNYTSEVLEANIVKDTLIQEKTYYILENPFGARFLRSEMGRVYMYDSFNQEDELILDFSLEIGDKYIFETLVIPGGWITDSLYVLDKDKILGPGQDSIYRLTLSRDPDFQLGGATWIEGVGDWVGGLFFDIPINKMTFAQQLCSLNSANQTIYTTEFFDCGCDKLYGVDNDRDGYRNHIGNQVPLDIIDDIFGSNIPISAKACDTLVLNFLDGSSVIVLNDTDEVLPDSTTNEQWFYFNLQDYQELTVTHQFSEILYTLSISECDMEDCDDNNPNINFGLTEIPYDGMDNDCNALTLDDDLDNDGFLFADDCDDSNANVNPDQVEIPYDGLDNDCDISTREDDLDNDGFLLADDCDDSNPNINPDAEEIVNNDIDEDCDGMDLLSSSYTLAESTISIFPNPVGDVLYINMDGHLEYQATLYSLSGLRIFSERDVQTVSTHSIPKGIYLLEIQDLDSKARIVEKLVKY